MAPLIFHLIPNYRSQLWHSPYGDPHQMSMSPFYFLLTHNEFTDSTFIFILSPVCFLPISISTVGGNFSISLFLALSSFPWAQDNALCYRPLLMHHENSCNITGNSVQYVLLWAILSSKLATAVKMIAVWLHSMFLALPMGDSSATLPI